MQALSPNSSPIQPHLNGSQGKAQSALLGKRVIHLLVGVAATPITVVRGAAKIGSRLIFLPLDVFKGIANEIELRRQPEQLKNACPLHMRLKEAAAAYLKENVKVALLGALMLSPMGTNLSEALQQKKFSLAAIFDTSPLASLTAGRLRVIDTIFNASSRSSMAPVLAIAKPVQEGTASAKLLTKGSAPSVENIKEELLNALKSGKSSCYVRVPVKGADEKIRYHDGIIHFPQSLLKLSPEEKSERLFTTPIASIYHQNAATIHNAETEVRDFLKDELQEYCVFCPCYAGDPMIHVTETAVPDTQVVHHVIGSDMKIAMHNLQRIEEEETESMKQILSQFPLEELRKSYEKEPTSEKLKAYIDQGLRVVKEMQSKNLLVQYQFLDDIEQQLEEMQKRYNNKPVDIGVGFSPTRCSEKLMREDAAADVALVHDLGWKRVAFAGASLGGAQAIHAAQALAKNHSDMTVDFVLLHNTFSSGEEAVEDTTRNWIESGEKEGAQKLATVLKPIASSIGACARQLMQDQVNLEKEGPGCNGLNNCTNLREVVENHQFSNTSFIIVGAEQDEFMTTIEKKNHSQKLAAVVQNQAVQGRGKLTHISQKDARHNTPLIGETASLVQQEIKRVATEYMP